jgi:hypothetical protein
VFGWHKLPSPRAVSMHCSNVTNPQFVPPPARSAAVNCAPRIVLSLSAFFRSDESEANSQNKKQDLHGRLLVISPLLQLLMPELYSKSCAKALLAPTVNCPHG